MLGLALLAGASVVGCQKCGGQSASADAAPPAAEASAAPTASAASAAPEPPEIRDTGRGRPTAALRAALGAYGIAYDAAEIERACKVDDENGASIDDLEDVANKVGLDAAQVILPEEHVLSPEAKLLPAILVVEGPDESIDFVLAWKLEGDRVLVMDPAEGRKLVPRDDLEDRLYIDEQTMPASRFRAAMGMPSFQDALRARMAALSVAKPQADALLGRAAGDPSVRGLGALDAAIRWVAGDSKRAGGDATGQLSAAFGCAYDKKCDNVEPIPADVWSVVPAAKDDALVRGAVVLAIAGRRTP